MRKLLPFLLMLGLTLAACGEKAQVYPYRWFYAGSHLDSDQELARLEGLVRTAAEHGLNGMLLFGDFDLLSLKDEAYFQRLARLRATCEQQGVEIIPRCLDMGYNDETILHHDRNLAEGLPVVDALFVAGQGQSMLVPDPAVTLSGGGFERCEGDSFPGFTPGANLTGQVVVDRELFHEGAAALRFENFFGREDGDWFLTQEVAVTPHRCYRLSAWVRSEGADGPEEGFPLRVQTPEGKRLEYFEPQVPVDGGWFRVVYGFNSLESERVVIAIGTMGAKSGRFWVDDLRLEEIGPLNIVRRSGAPLRVRGEADGTEYEEGRDFARLEDPVLDFRFDREAPALELLPDSRIQEGERLRVSWHHGMTIYYHQVPACLSEPKIYDLWRQQVELIHRHLAPQKYFLSVDELRMGGNCEGCRARGLTMGELVGDCLSRQVQIVRAIDPAAEVLTWSDMFDPNHNANPRPQGYYLAAGSYEGSWEHLPRDLVIACWYHERRRPSLAHFDSLGFRTLACGYYDRDDLANDSTWLEALDATPGAVGIMYTTWGNKYELLDEFGDLVSSHQR